MVCCFSIIVASNIVLTASSDKSTSKPGQAQGHLEQNEPTKLKLEQKCYFVIKQEEVLVNIIIKVKISCNSYNTVLVGEISFLKCL